VRGDDVRAEACIRLRGRPDIARQLAASFTEREFDVA
jgi:hypothetical protein